MTEDGRQKTEDGRQKTEDGRQKTEIPRVPGRMAAYVIVDPVDSRMIIAEGID
jgi:hypothetical protein